MNLYFSKTMSFEHYEGFHLLQDHMGTNHSSPWNDYDYIVKFKVFFVKKEESNYLGYLRILVDGFQDSSKYFMEKGVVVDSNIYEISNVLTPDLAVSLPLDIDYYYKLNKLLGPDRVESALSLLCDASYYYDRILSYKNWDGFSGSVMREGSSAEAILRKGHQIAIGRYSPEESFYIDISPSSGNMEPVQFYFDNNRNFGKTNVNVLTGKNGAGKSFLLKELTEIVTGLRQIEQKWPYFHKLIVVAYSPFEDFYTKEDILKGLDRKYTKRKKAKKNTSERIRLNINEYAYVGFRNESGNFNIDWPKIHSFDALRKILEFDQENFWWDDRGRFEILKDTLSLCMSFDSIAVKSSDSKDIIEIDGVSKKNIEILKNGAAREEGLFFIKDGKPLKLSSGQKIYSYMIPAVVSEIENESLIVFDEPELYLHPSLEVGLVNMLKYLLSETSSYSIIATHSAILTREVEKRGVKILRKIGDNTLISSPGFETYGESLEAIIGEVFEDYSVEKPFQHDLDELIKNGDDLESVLSKVGEDIGDEALAYVVSKFSGDTDYPLEIR